MKDLSKSETAETKPLTTEISANIAVIKFTRPQIRNPLSVETLEILSKTFAELEENKEIETVIFTGTKGVFAAGANLREVARLDEDTAKEFGLRGQILMQKIYGSRKRTIAAIEGFCMGGALDLALSCKIRIASPETIFAHPGAKLGIITGWSGTQILPHLIGRKKALELFLTAKKITAEEALEINLIDYIQANPLKYCLQNF